MIDVGLLGFPFMLLLSLLWFLLYFGLAVWVVYDILCCQPRMNPIEKVGWALVAFLIGYIGPLIYLLLVKARGQPLFEEGQLPELRRDTDLERLEKLGELREQGVITEDEFKELKKEILEKQG